MNIRKRRIKRLASQDSGETFSEESEETYTDSEGDTGAIDHSRKAGISSLFQIEKFKTEGLNKDFQWTEKPWPWSLGAHQKLKVLQDIDNSERATVFDAEGNVLGTFLDISSQSWKDIVRYNPSDVDGAMKGL